MFHHDVIRVAILGRVLLHFLSSHKCQSILGVFLYDS